MNWREWKANLDEQVKIQQQKAKEEAEQQAEEKRQLKAQQKAELAQLKRDEKFRVKKMKAEKIPFCPKCKSTSLQYIERRQRVSLLRGMAGSLINPVAGVVGAVTSHNHKNYVKCLNCGYEWRIR